MGAGVAEGQRVSLVSAVEDGITRRVEGLTVVPYDLPAGCVAAYFPETNVLVPLDSTADESGTPTSKSIVVRLEPAADPHAVLVK